MAQTEYPVAMRPRAPQPPPWYDLQRLQELRDEFKNLREELHRAGDRVREAKQSLAQERAAMLIGPKAGKLRSLKIEAIGQLSVEDLDEVQISPQAVQRLLVQERRVAAMQRTADEAAAGVKRMAPFMEKLEAFARTRNL